MRIARQFVILLVLCGAAALCTLAGSMFAHLITVIDHQPALIEVPSRPTPGSPIPAEQRERSFKEESDPAREPAMDLFGNEVTEAVAKYLLDSKGALHEEHSPQTEEPRLPPPEG